MLSAIDSLSQKDKRETIEKYFLNLPVFGTYDQLMEFLNSNRFVRIDSITTKHTVFGSITEPVAKQHFTDSGDVIIRIDRKVFRDSITREVLDTSTLISVGQFFNDNSEYAL